MSEKQEINLSKSQVRRISIQKGIVMIHDELLKKLSSTNRRYAGSQDNAALRSIVELHKPTQELVEKVKGVFCSHCEFDYPCPTIQAIEKELND